MSGPNQVLRELRTIVCELGGSWPAAADPLALAVLRRFLLHPLSVEDRLLAFLRATEGSTTLTHEKIAEAIGSTRETVSRTLKELGMRSHSVRHRAKILPRVRSLFVDGEFTGSISAAAYRLGINRATVRVYFIKLGATRDRSRGGSWRIPLSMREAA